MEKSIDSQSSVNERHRKVINRLLDGFEGKLSTSKYVTLAKCSTDPLIILDAVDELDLRQIRVNPRPPSNPMAAPECCHREGGPDRRATQSRAPSVGSS